MNVLWLQMEMQRALPTPSPHGRREVRGSGGTVRVIGNRIRRLERTLVPAVQDERESLAAVLRCVAEARCFSRQLDATRLTHPCSTDRGRGKRQPAGQECPRQSATLADFADDQRRQ